VTDNDTAFVIFIDYDNLLPTQKTAGILDVVTRALIQISMDTATTRAMCDVRVYGGWYEGTKITRLAENLTVEIQRDFPKIIRLSTSRSGYITISANAELAVALIQEPGHHLFNTYRRKGKPVNIRVEVANCGWLYRSSLHPSTDEETLEDRQLPKTWMQCYGWQSRLQT
jgi:hypothetical protein